MILPDVEEVLFSARTFKTAGVMSPSPIPIMTAAIVIVAYDGSRMKKGTQEPDGNYHRLPHTMTDVIVSNARQGIAYAGDTEHQSRDGGRRPQFHLHVLRELRRIQEHQEHGDEDHHIGECHQTPVRSMFCDDITLLRPYMYRLPQGHQCEKEQEESQSVDQERIVPSESGQETPGQLENQRTYPHGSGLIAEYLHAFRTGIVLRDECGTAA